MKKIKILMAYLVCLLSLYLVMSMSMITISNTVEELRTDSYSFHDFGGNMFRLIDNLEDNLWNKVFEPGSLYLNMSLS